MSTTFFHPDLDAAAVGALLAQAGVELGPARRVRRTVLDTFDGRLHAAGLTLEVVDAGGLELVLSSPDSPPARVAVSAAPVFASDLPVGPFHARLAQVMEVRALRPVLGVAAGEVRGSRRNRTGKTLVTVTLHDPLAVTSPRLVDLGWRVEVGAVAGYDKAAGEMRDLLRSLGLQPERTTVLDLAATAAGVDLRGFSGSPTVPLDADQPAIDGFRTVLANLASAIDANWQGTVDAIDPEFLHDLRVAVRRTRSVLSQGKRVLPDEVRDDFRNEFGWLGGVTSPVRDLDVYVIEWEGYVRPLGADSAADLVPVLRHIQTRRRAEQATLGEELRSERYRSVVGRWNGWLHADPRGDSQPAPAAKEATRPVGRVAASRIAGAQERLLVRGRRIRPETPAAEVHELRKDAKKLRYLLECFGGLFPTAPRKAFVQQLKSLQDNLGEHQDTEVHAAHLRGMSHELHGSPDVTGDTLLAMGRLTEQFDRRRIAARAEFAHRFAAYDSKQTARHLGELLRR